jgi:hypothetical protein
MDAIQSRAPLASLVAMLLPFGASWLHTEPCVPPVSSVSVVAPAAPPNRLRPKRVMHWDPRNKTWNESPPPEAERVSPRAWLRLAMADGAVSCWRGGDQSEDIELAYTIVVEHEALRVAEVRVVRSEISDLMVSSCIVGAVADVSMLAEGLPDLRQDSRLTISLHDLYVRNRAEREEAEELLADRIARLRRAAVDGAAACWVHVVEDMIPDPAISACVVGAIRDLTAFADGLPDLRQEETVRISLHDLSLRNRAAVDP